VIRLALERLFRGRGPNRRPQSKRKDIVCGPSNGRPGTGKGAVNSLVSLIRRLNLTYNPSDVKKSNSR
jgi:hypothetical protein